MKQKTLAMATGFERFGKKTKQALFRSCCSGCHAIPGIDGAQGWWGRH